MSRNNITRITVEQGDAKASWEMPYNDAPIESVLQGLVGCLVTHTWDEEVVLNAMLSFSAELLGKNIVEAEDVEPVTE